MHFKGVDWKWDDDREEEITFMYGWDLLPWMKQVQPPFASVDNRDERTTGMQVPYEIKPDQYGGKGLFAKEDVKAGTMVWSKPKSNCTIKTEAEMKEYCETATHEELLLILNFCYCEDDGLFTFVDITQDDGGYFNHTNGKPNIALGVEYQRHQVKDCGRLKHHYCTTVHHEPALERTMIGCTGPPVMGYGTAHPISVLSMS